MTGRIHEASLPPCPEGVDSRRAATSTFRPLTPQVAGEGRGGELGGLAGTSNEGLKEQRQRRWGPDSSKPSELGLSTSLVLARNALALRVYCEGAPGCRQRWECSLEHILRQWGVFRHHS